MRPRRRGGRSRGSSGVPPSTVAVGATVSGLVGLVASSLPEGTRVLAPDVEFTSTLFPFLVQAHRGVTVRTVPAAELAGAIDDSTDVVAFSAVQMATGEVADLDAIAARGEGARSADAGRRDPGLRLAPARRVRVRRRRRGGLQVAALAARHRVHGGRTGTARRGRPHRRRLVRRRGRARDVLRRAAAARDRRPPARHLARLAQLGRRGTRARAARGDRRRARSTRTTSTLANRFRAGLGLEPGDSAIVFVDVPDAAARLERAGIRAAVRGGRVRTSWHLYNTGADVDRALEALT